MTPFRTEPLVSVLLPVYNGEPFVSSAIESILQQTYDHFELIVVDDGSTDGTAQTLQQFARADERISVVAQPENRGLVSSLNLAIGNAHGTYLARQDADDLSDPERLAHSVDFLESNPDIIMVGTHAVVIDPTDQVTGEYPLPPGDGAIVTPRECRRRLLDQNCFVHGSVLMRNHPDITYENAVVEDYALWCKLALDHRLAILRKPLYRYRQEHAGRFTDRHAESQQVTIRRIRRAYARQLAEQHDFLPIFDACFGPAIRLDSEHREWLLGLLATVASEDAEPLRPTIDHLFRRHPFSLQAWLREHHLLTQFCSTRINLQCLAGAILRRLRYLTVSHG